MLGKCRFWWWQLENYIRGRERELRRLSRVNWLGLFPFPFFCAGALNFSASLLPRAKFARFLFMLIFNSSSPKKEEVSSAKKCLGVTLRFPKMGMGEDCGPSKASKPRGLEADRGDGRGRRRRRGKRVNRREHEKTI